MKKSKKILFLVTICIGFCGISISCDKDNRTKAPQSKRLELDSTSSYSDQNYRTYTLEGCEYVVVGVGKERWGSHKGNCKNLIHNQ
jgi:hypothetical protein